MRGYGNEQIEESGFSHIDYFLLWELLRLISSLFIVLASLSSALLNPVAYNLQTLEFYILCSVSYSAISQPGSIE